MTALPDAHGGDSAGSLTESNREVVRAAFERWRAGTSAITDLFAPDMTWRIEGHSLASKEYRDTQQFIDEVLAPFAARFRAGKPFGPVRIRAILADGDNVVVLWDGRGVANDERTYENSYAWFMQLQDGKVIDGTAFYDSVSFDELWTQVKPQ